MSDSELTNQAYEVYVLLQERGLHLQDLSPGTEEYQSLAGFGGRNENILSRMQADDEVLRQLNVAYSDLGLKLSKLLLEARVRGNAILDRHSDGRKLCLSSITTPGYQRCPGKDGESTSTEYIEIIDPEKGYRWSRLSPLHAHLVGKHSFFQGQGSFYRLEPVNAVLLTHSVDSIPELKKIAWEQLRGFLVTGIGLRADQLHNFLLPSAEESELPTLLDAFVSQRSNEPSLIENYFSFLEFISPVLSKKFLPLVVKFRNRRDLVNWQKIDRLLRIIDNDTDYPVIGNQYLPDLLLQKNRSAVTFCANISQERKIDLADILSEGNAYWRTAAMLFCTKECYFKRPTSFRLDSSDLPLSIKLSRVVGEQYIDEYRNKYDSSFPHNIQTALAAEGLEDLVVWLEQNTPQLVPSGAEYQSNSRDPQSDLLISYSENDISKRTPAELEKRLDFYEWVFKLAILSVDIQLAFYCQRQKIITLRALGRPQEALIAEAELARFPV